MKTNEFKITQYGDEDFRITRLYIVTLDTFANIFRKKKKTVKEWRTIYDNKNSGKYYSVAKKWKTIEAAKAYIDKVLKDEATYPIETKHP